MAGSQNSQGQRTCFQGGSFIYSRMTELDQTKTGSGWICEQKAYRWPLEGSQGSWTFYTMIQDYKSEYFQPAKRKLQSLLRSRLGNHTALRSRINHKSIQIQGERTRASALSGSAPMSGASKSGNEGTALKKKKDLFMKQVTVHSSTHQDVAPPLLPKKS